MTDGRKLLSNFVFTNTYARHLPRENRRERYSEAVGRICSMLASRVLSHVDSDDAFPLLDVLYHDVREAMLNKEVLASQRAMQYGGEPVEKHNMRVYNCTSSYCDRPRFFAEAFYLGLCGSGVGYSVSHEHISSLPELISVEKWRGVDSDCVDFVVEDSIEGWADSVDRLISYYFGFSDFPVFNYSNIRPKGARLGSGGKAPGHEPLKRAHEDIENLFDRLISEGARRLRSIDCLDIVCFTQRAVKAGGQRRAATICVFDDDDALMIHAKTDDWREKNIQRELANISAMIVTDGTEQRERFDKIYESARVFAEPGTIFAQSKMFAYNPCCEIGMCPVLIHDPKGEVVAHYTLDMLNNKDKYKQLGYTYLSGWQACNLTEINTATVRSPEDLMKRARIASIIGTIQATFTDTGYLGRVSQLIIEREALLGVSLTGIMDNPKLILDEELLRRAANIVVATNNEWAKLLKINPAARATTVKPAGTSSIILNAVSSGIHARRGRRMIRRVRTNNTNAVYQHFKAINPSLCEPSATAPDVEDVISFPLDSSESDAVEVREISALKFLGNVHLVQRSWVQSGCANKLSVEGLGHNVSNTCPTRIDEWDEAADFVWRFRYVFTGITLMSEWGMLAYPQLPEQEIYIEEELKQMFDATDADIEAGQLVDGDEMKRELFAHLLRELKTWRALTAAVKDVDYTKLRETEDVTAPSADPACAGGACAVSFV